MSVTRRVFLGSTAAFAGTSALAALEAPAKKPAPAKAPVPSQKPAPKKPAPLPPEPPTFETADGQATANVLGRRLVLDLLGRIPSKAEALGFGAALKNRAAFVDKLLSSDGFADYWSMHFCDILRVKSEFPINLWPNAVYVYHRRIRAFVQKDEPWTQFARSLLLATGSDFRDAEVNFLRATARRTPEGFAEVAALTFLGWQWQEVPAARQKELASYFACVRIKNTREWKEEIVQVEGPDRRAAFVKRLFGEWRNAFATAFVKRVDWWLLGRTEADPEHVKIFVKNGFRLRPLVRAIVMSRAYSRGSVTGGFPVRRLDAEILDDAIHQFTYTPRAYQSIAPEPFTFLPKDRPSILIEDGSISNAFLLLFGRPARDSGLLSERHNEVTAKQRLYLFNSGWLFSNLGRLVDNKNYRKQKMPAIIDDLYWRILARPPRRAERASLLARQAKLANPRERWRFPRDLAWALINSREFLFQH
ncbi:MAG: DUF1553 domain-containing protein [Kiritimatiellae bacterium]|nr:DUF1553 domain-containing protein [Kiritimatiellia bacterium]